MSLPSSPTLPKPPLLECALVQARVTFILWLSLLAAVCTQAEVIHLKNGKTIWADHVREDNGRVEYDVGENTFAIPKSVVDKIDAGGVPPQYASSIEGLKETLDLPTFSSGNNLKDQSAVLSKIVHDGRVIEAGPQHASTDKAMITSLSIDTPSPSRRLASPPVGGADIGRCMVLQRA